MKSKVYFTPVSGQTGIPAMQEKISLLLDKSGILDILKKNDKAAVKVHFGEAGNTGFVRPEFVAKVCEGIKAKGAVPFVSDANTLYRGRRMNTPDHIAVALEHGFDPKVTGAQLVIPDDTKKSETVGVKIDGKYIKTAKIARFYKESDALVVVSHFKGHMLTGFGGAIKNVGMGCATREGKLAQHCDLAPALYTEKCIACGACVAICPANAIKIVDQKARVDKSKCIGCANCVGVCPTSALFVDLEAGVDVQVKMAEYAMAVVKDKPGKTAYVSFAININKECDCWGMHNPRIASDVGIFASLDPVAIDKACMEIVNSACGKDIFKATHPDQDGNIQLEYAEKLGLGNTRYELIQV